MTPARLRRELADLAGQRDRIEPQRAQYAQALERALTSDHYDGNVIAGMRADLHAAETRLRDLDERHTLLSAKLPTPAQVQQAEREIVTLRRAITDAAEHFDAAAAAYGEALEIAEGAARRLQQCRAIGHDAVAAVKQLADDAGLEVDIPPEPALRRQDAELYHLQALLASEAAFGEPDDVVLRDLAAARVATIDTVPF